MFLKLHRLIIKSVNMIIMLNILKEIGKISRTYGWEGIKSFISLKTVVSTVPTVFSLDNITNPYDIANTFNNYCASVAETTQKSIKYSHKHF